MVRLLSGKFLPEIATPEQQKLRRRAADLLKKAKKRDSLKRRLQLEERAAELLRRANTKQGG